ncbi:MAG: acyltransferase [Candidatus Eiseniibacteriota bacterium]
MATTLVPHQRIPLGHLLVFGWMPSPLKKWAYRVFRGYHIGRSVKLSFGSIVEGRSVDLGDHVEIGLLAMVIGREIRIGRHSSIGMLSYVSCRRIEIGEDARIREQVSIGGPELPESRFVLGDRTVVLQHTAINPTMPVTIGDDSGIGGHCLIFTHGAWLNVLDGYPVTYEPVTIGRSVWLPWRVFVMPGATIGDGSVIGANSLVSGTIPPMSLAVGSPARVIRRAPEFPRVPTEAGRRELLGEIIREFIRFVEGEGVQVQTEGSVVTFARSGRTHRLHVGHDRDAIAGAVRGDTVLADIANVDVTSDLTQQGIDWLDLRARARSENGGPLTEELAAFLGRYGIRLARARQSA